MLLLNGGTFASVCETKAAKTALNNESLIEIEKSIKVCFGSEFRVLTQARSGNYIFAEIAHLGNTYKVVSSSRHDWTILSSTIQ